ncbi:MAG: hypothetical protein ACJ74U_10285 [Jatrophihabitantaceae bacterium]
MTLLRTTEDVLTDQYLTGFAASGLSASALLEALRPSLVDTGFIGRSLSRPVFLSYQQIQQLGADVQQLYATLTGLPRRIFGGDMAAFARAVGATQTQAEVVLRGTASVPSRMGRADFYLDEQGFKLLEVNWGAALGGLDSAILNRSMAEQPFIGDFVERHRLGYVDPMVELVHTLFTECGVPAGRRPAVALTDWPASFVTLEPRLRRNVPDYARLGIDAYPCHLGQLRYADGRVWLGEQAIDVVYRLFLMEDLLDPTGPGLIEPVLQAAERGDVAIFSPMDADLYGSKGALALLSDEQYRHCYTAEELASLARILPWTRMVRPGPVTVAGRQVDLFDYALAERRELIIKPTMMHGGLGLVPGWLTPADEWRQRLEAAMDQPYVLQRRIHPIPERFPTDNGSDEWTITWGAIMVSRGYGGMFVRGSRDLDGTVNMTSGATATCCFHPLAED